MGAASGWVFNIAILFLNEWFDGYKFASLGSVFSVLVRSMGMIFVHILTIKRSGRMDRILPALECIIQHHNVTAHFLPYGLLLVYTISFCHSF